MIRKRKRKKWIVLVVVIFAVVLFMRGGNHRTEPVPESKWNETKIGTILPYPGTKKIDVLSDYDDRFSADVEKYSAKSYEDYIERCKEAGFTVDAKTENNGYDAYTEDGYYLQLSYYEYNEEMSIDLDAPIEMDKFQWPSSEIARQLPVPKSNVGAINVESASQLSVYVGETSREEYNAYVTACAEKGFTKDYSKGDDTYQAENQLGYSLHLKYRGYNTMEISLYAPNDAETNTEQPAETTETETPEKTETGDSQAASNTVDPDLKAFLDEYEAFMDQYVDFMKKYAESDDTSGMLSDYAKMMAQYSNFAEKLEDYDEEEMSTADLAYYLEVTNRVNQKLLEVA